MVAGEEINDCVCCDDNQHVCSGANAPASSSADDDSSSLFFEELEAQLTQLHSQLDDHDNVKVSRKKRRRRSSVLRKLSIQPMARRTSRKFRKFRRKQTHLMAYVGILGTCVGTLGVVIASLCSPNGKSLLRSFGLHSLLPMKDLPLSALPSSQTPQQRLQQRRLSVNLGNGDCKWEPPVYNVPNQTFKKTLVAGFPSGDKRLVFVQMEALTGLPAKDEWDFKFLGMSNHPFIKANYPHHEGTWGWESEADQVVMVVRNIRRSMVEYHDILWDIGYAKTWDDAFERIANLYAERPPLEDYFVWRDLRVMDEISWYGWFIDYYMEEGLMRDMFTKKLTTPEHWRKLMEPTGYTRAQLEYGLNVPNETVVTPSYDPLCIDHISGGCHPVKIISGERLVRTDTGPAEGRKIAEVLQGNEGIDDYLIEEEAWECIWDALIIKKKGLKTFLARPDEGNAEEDYNFSEEMLEKMLEELDYLITKYSGPDWNWRETAQDLVGLLTEHRALIQTELEEVQAGTRRLGIFDILGEKARRKLEKDSVSESDRTKAVVHTTDGKRRLELDGKSNKNVQQKNRFDFSYAEKMLAERRRKKLAEIGVDSARYESMRRR